MEAFRERIGAKVEKAPFWTPPTLCFLERDETPFPRSQSRNLAQTNAFWYILLGVDFYLIVGFDFTFSVLLETMSP